MLDAYLKNFLNNKNTGELNLLLAHKNETQNSRCCQTWVFLFFLKDTIHMVRIF